MSTWVWLAFVAVLNSAISLYYYVMVIRAMYIEKPNKGAEGKFPDLPATFVVAITVCAALVVLLGVYPDLILDLCRDAAIAVLP